jgi:GNAT superfamily N-acetyltransferase
MIDGVSLFVDAWKLMVGRMPQPTIREEHGIVSCFANVSLTLLNVSIVTRPAETSRELRALLDTAADHAEACTHPTSVLLREDWLPTGWVYLVAEAGLSPMIPLTTMETEAVAPPVRALPKLDARRIADDAMARDLARLNALAYHMPPGAFDCIGNVHLWRADSLAYVGYVGSKPVSCAAAFPVGGTVYIALVATLPEEQGKGYAEIVMRKALTEGQQTMRTTHTTLHASDRGRSLYRQMGYGIGSKMVILQRAK